MMPCEEKTESCEGKNAQAALESDGVFVRFQSSPLTCQQFPQTGGYIRSYRATTTGTTDIPETEATRSSGVFFMK